MTELHEVILLTVVNEVIHSMDNMPLADDAIDEGMSPDDYLIQIADACVQAGDIRERLIYIAATAMHAVKVLDLSAMDAPDNG